MSSKLVMLCQHFGGQYKDHNGSGSPLCLIVMKWAWLDNKNINENTHLI